MSGDTTVKSNFFIRPRCRSKTAARRLHAERLETRILLTAAHLPSFFGSGPDQYGTLTYQAAFDANRDSDSYVVELRAGDVINVRAQHVSGDALSALALHNHAGQVLMRTDSPIPALPQRSPVSAGDDIGLAYVVTESGKYHIDAESDRAGQFGGYTIEFQVFRPTLEGESEGTRQVLFLDFDGARINPYALFGDGKNHDIELSPLSEYLHDFGLVDANSSAATLKEVENLLTDQIVSTVRENLVADVAAAGANDDFALTIMDSRRGADPWGLPHVSRVLVGGGNSQTGVVGDIAESVDVGNMVTNETALVQIESKTHLLNGNLSWTIAPALEGRRDVKIELIGTYLGNVISHEAAHLFGLYHTESTNQNHVLMDRALDAFFGDDQIFGTADDFDLDFGADDLWVSDSDFFDSYTQGGRVSNVDWLSFSLTTGRGVEPSVHGDVNRDGAVDAIDLNVIGKHWQQYVESGTDGDLNGDGVVNGLDLLQVSLGWILATD